MEMSRRRDDISSVYESGVDGLVRAVQELSLAGDGGEIQGIVRRAARALTGADGATLVLRDGDEVVYADEDAIAPLWKGRRFPIGSCVSGWAMLHRRPVVIEDVEADDRVPREAYRSTFVKSLAIVPIRASDPLGAIGNYWADPHVPTPSEMGLLQALADSTAVAMARAELLASLEQRVAERTAALAALSLTDELTGVANRRGFLVRAEQVRKVIRRHGGSSLVLFIDIDGLKQVNDSFGHAHGDRLIQEAAALLASTLREEDVVGRWGGDEFVAYLPDLGDPRVVAERIEAAVAAANGHRLGAPLSLSMGLTVVNPDEPRSLGELLGEADAAMYLDKRNHRGSMAAG